MRDDAELQGFKSLVVKPNRLTLMGDFSVAEVVCRNVCRNAGRRTGFRSRCHLLEALKLPE